jgi:hypothetical protein
MLVNKQDKNSKVQDAQKVRAFALGFALSSMAKRATPAPAFKLA